MLTLNKLVSDNGYGGQVKRELFNAMLANKLKEESLTTK
jgi:hypothetical protein